jgi:hypothetical protein
MEQESEGFEHRPSDLGKGEAGIAFHSCLAALFVDVENDWNSVTLLLGQTETRRHRIALASASHNIIWTSVGLRLLAGPVGCVLQRAGTKGVVSLGVVVNCSESDGCANGKVKVNCCASHFEELAIVAFG